MTPSKSSERESTRIRRMCANESQGRVSPEKNIRGNSQDSQDSRSEALNERNSQMATKTKSIAVKVGEQLAEAISDKAVKAWHATNYSNGKKRVYVTFEEVVSA